MFNIYLNDSDHLPEDDVCYIVAKNGIFLKKKLGIFESMAQVDQISILEGLEPYASINIEKIPGWKFAQVFTLFKDVCNEYSSEANTILHYNPEIEDYIIEIPKQGVSGGGVDYESTKTIDGYLRVGTIHSHNNFSAFHSGTDHHDEATWDGIHITIGNVNQKCFSLSMEIVANGTRFKVTDPSDYVEDLVLGEYEEPGCKTYKYVCGKLTQVQGTNKTLGYTIKGYENGIDYPEKWLDNIEKSKPKPLAIASNTTSLGTFNISSGIFDGDMFDHTEDDFSHLGGWDPCEQCHYKHYKSEKLLQGILEGLSDTELDALGFKETNDELNSDDIPGGN